MRGLDRLQFLEQAVVLGVGNRRCVEYVVGVVVARDLRAQRGSALHRRGFAGGRIGLYAPDRVEQVHYSANRRCASGPPAGMPTSSMRAWNCSIWPRMMAAASAPKGARLSSTTSPPS